MKHITTDELKRITTEGLVLQGCGGDLNEWVSGINGMLTDSGILREDDTFKDVYAFEHGGLTNLLFNMEGVNLDTGKLAMWRLQSHDTFGGTWLSDYLPNRLGVDMPEKSTERPSLLDRLDAAKEKTAETKDKPAQEIAPKSSRGPEL